MATRIMGSLRLVEHRRWQDIVVMILGAAILVSPMFGDTTSNTMMVVTIALAGAAILILGGVEQLFLRRWEEFLAFLCGAWVMLAPFVLEYGGPLRMWHVGLGAAVVILAVLELWQDNDRNLAS
ncbi:hypothetical protein EET67_06295 [Pseudaminobacter arsenicus]|uniref:SPW repeat-containing integral membrane domain-containing protein n=1 Tax=Borborobacter arsenicus TaxID=1851146 RepID=A0A432V939_9HYPH|nr:hypothetical protein [Pseudaminobacter arsenicus]RUM98708.1 hypothetical protein EET67_06295 [Pseudaminobacter arsenicus]